MLLGLSAAFRLLRVLMRIFTRHHATLHHVKYPSGLKWISLCNYVATTLLLFQKVRNDSNRLGGAPSRKVHILIHHGFDLSYFRHAFSERVQILCDRYAPVQKAWGSYGRYCAIYGLKGIDFVMEALPRVKAAYPSGVLVLANAHGDYAQQIKSALKQFAPDSYREIVFEQDLSVRYHS